MAILSSYKWHCRPASPFVRWLGCWWAGTFNGSFPGRPTEPRDYEEKAAGCSFPCPCQASIYLPPNSPCPTPQVDPRPCRAQTILGHSVILLTPHFVPGQGLKHTFSLTPVPGSTFALGFKKFCSQPLHRRAMWLSPLCPKLLDDSGSEVRVSSPREP